MIPNAFVKYLYHFHSDRDYFECHEILEEFWKDHTPQLKNSHWVGFILLAVSNYHHRRKNFTGAKRTLDKAITILSNEIEQINAVGLDGDKLMGLLYQHRDALIYETPYVSYSLPISNPILIEKCKEWSSEDKGNWVKVSDLTNISIVNKHKLRDRSNVINDREKALLKRKEKTEN